MSPKPPLSPKTPPLQSCDPRSRIRRAFSKREFIKGKPFTQLLPTFCPLFISPCKYLPCQAFVIQNVFSLHRQLRRGGVSVSTNPVSSQVSTVLLSMHLTRTQQSLEDCMLISMLHNLCLSFRMLFILLLLRYFRSPIDIFRLRSVVSVSFVKSYGQDLIMFEGESEFTLSYLIQRSSRKSMELQLNHVKNTAVRNMFPPS